MVTQSEHPEGKAEPPKAVPHHVAIIMDGNGRWAKARHLPRSAGHRQGMEAVRRTVRAAAEMGIGCLTLFGFSSENWKRPEAEVNDLMGLLRLYLSREASALHEQGVRVRVIGNRTRLAPDIRNQLSRVEEMTRDNGRLDLVVALSYGGRDDIVRAARALAEDAKAGRIDPAAIDEKALAERLFTRDIPDPDLLIRTSGEKRISNFLLWQMAYSEFVFLDTLWPDFGRDDLEAAVREFAGRERRYGALAP